MFWNRGLSEEEENSVTSLKCNSSECSTAYVLEEDSHLVSGIAKLGVRLLFFRIRPIEKLEFSGSIFAVPAFKNSFVQGSCYIYREMEDSIFTSHVYVKFSQSESGWE